MAGSCPGPPGGTKPQHCQGTVHSKEVWKCSECQHSPDNSSWSWGGGGSAAGAGVGREDADPQLLLTTAPESFPAVLSLIFPVF